MRSVSILGSGFMGIQNSEQASNFTQYLCGIAMHGHYSQMNVIRVLALQILRNVVYEMLYNSELNQH